MINSITTGSGGATSSQAILEEWASAEANRSKIAPKMQDAPCAELRAWLG